MQLDAAAVLFQNFPDDRETEAGALLARRHIGLEQARAVFHRQTDAVVDDVDQDVAVHSRCRYLDAALLRPRRQRRDRLGAVLDDVGEGLRDQPAVEPCRHRILGKVDFDIDVGMADPHQEHRLAHGVGDVFGFDHRFRHARKAREFVDHAPDVVDLAHDRVGALLEDRAVFGDHLTVFAAQPLRRKLDRRQRILDLMRDPACHVGPGRGALRDHEFGDVVERDNITVFGVGRLLAGDTHRQIALAAPCG